MKKGKIIPPLHNPTNGCKPHLFLKKERGKNTIFFSVHNFFIGKRSPKLSAVSVPISTQLASFCTALDSNLPNSILVSFKSLFQAPFYSCMSSIRIWIGEGVFFHEKESSVNCILGPDRISWKCIYNPSYITFFAVRRGRIIVKRRLKLNLQSLVAAGSSCKIHWH